MALLSVNGVTKDFGGLRALNNVDLAVEPGEVVGLIGPNGAGKTTLFNVITGFQQPTEGTVYFKGKNITRLLPEKRVESGLARTFQVIVTFPHLPVFAHVLLGCYSKYRTSFWETLFNLPSYRQQEMRAARHAMAIMEELGIAHLKLELPGSLPIGHLRLLEIAMALATEPELLLLDEPLSGLNPAEIDLVANVMKKLKERGLGILLAEHNVSAVMACCDRIAVLNFGIKIAEGPPSEIRDNPDVIKAYLGEEEKSE